MKIQAKKEEEEGEEEQKKGQLQLQELNLSPNSDQ